MSPRTRSQEEPGLFDDLPLRQDISDPPRTKPDKRQQKSLPEPLPLFPESPETESREPSTREDSRAAVDRVVRRPPVPRQAYLSAGLVDLGILLGVALLIWLGLAAIGVKLDGPGFAILALFFLPFSFLYQVFPLAFWGRTPGMARVGLVARGEDGRALSFSQAGRRWLASVLTVLLLGLPLALTHFTGRSLADRLSDSQTLPAR